MEVKEKKRVGLVYDDRMCKHHTPDGEDHPENPLRIKAIWEKLQSAGIPQRCVVMSAKEAEDRHIGLVHTKKHIDLIRKISSKAYDSKRDKIAARLNSIYLNKGSSEAAYLAAGSVIEASERVATGELNSAVAIVRPPGHHAEADEAMGFCLYNNVAIAGSVLLNEKPELGIKKILIVDWDVHHGNGTQKMFWKDPRVLFFSVHRFDFGTFYPTGDDGSHTQVGEDLGAGYNINVPWEHGQCGDVDYLAAWEHILIPVARAFGPDIVLISGGFDAAVGDPLGGCRVTPYGYSVMMKKLMEFAQGKIMMALEGGYNLDSVANSVLACVKALLDDKPIIGSSEVYPFDSTWRVIQAVRGELSAFWPTLADELPAKLLLKKVSPVELISSSDSDAENDEEVSVKPTCSETVAVVNDLGVVENVIRDFSVLKVAETAHDQVVDGSVLWRSVLSKIYVWYGSFGSNMWKPRLLCYIEGGKVDGMQKSCSGSMDKTPPKSVMWKTVPHRLFFGRSHTDTWGSGGVAFLHPQSSTHDVTYMCLYKITLEQFNDILLQENGQNVSTISPLFDLNALDSAVQSNFISLESLKGGWYSNVLYLGTEGGLPILTMTCPLSNVENFRSGKHPLKAPPKNYMNTLVKGLVEGKQLSEEEAISYINDASAQRDEALAWLKGASFPPNWDKFVTRDIVCERRFRCVDICQKSALNKVRLVTDNALDILDCIKHFREYADVKDYGFSSLTRLFYASLSVSEDGESIKGFIGAFKFSFTMSDLVNLYDNDKTFTDKATNIFTEEFRESIPFPEVLLQTLFIVPNKKPHALIKHLHLLFDMIIHYNILPSKGNKTEMTRRMIELVWIMENHTPCLAHVIFHNIKDVLRNKKSVVLPYPCMVASLLKAKGFVFPEYHESPLPLYIVDHKIWDRFLLAGSDTRMDAFDAKGLRYTEGLVVGGTILEESHPSFVSRKRKAVSAPKSSSSNSEVIARLESSIATLTSAVTTMNVLMNGIFDSLIVKIYSLNVKLDKFQADMEVLKVGVAAMKPIILSYGDDEAVALREDV